MIPIRDTIPTKNYPIINVTLIALNVMVYFVQIAQGEGLNRFITIYGLLPVRYSDPQVSIYFTGTQQIISFFSYMFLHGGFWHLLGNMWSLFIFGDNVEDRLGHIRYLFFYFLCGFASGLSHLLINWHSAIPTIGASGAIAGVMGAYFLLHPGAKILTLIPIFFIPYFIELPAFIFLGIWFIMQFLSAAWTSSGGGIAWWAHIGGFVFGLFFLKIFQKIPEWGVTRKISDKTLKKRSHRLQVINTTARDNDLNLYGSIVISPREADAGTKKLVNVPWGFQRRLLKVTVPPGVLEGTSLRLSGMGKRGGNVRGDLYLKVKIGDRA